MTSAAAGAASLLFCLAAAGAQAPALGVYEGNEPADVGRFEQWLGCPVQQVLVFTDPSSWNGIARPQWFIDRFAAVDRPALWSVALVPKSGDLAAAGQGAYDDSYESAARALALAPLAPDGSIRVRTGWELNGDWFPWAAKGREALFVSAYRHLVTAFRSVSARFRFEWNINYGQTMDPAGAYPGDGFVDVIGMDFYWMPKFQDDDPVRAFALIRDDRYGLRYIDRFAAAHRKPLAFSEWGVQGDHAKPFIFLVANWIKSHHVLYHDYWDSNADYPGRLSSNLHPRSGAAFRQAFCRSGARSDGTLAGRAP